MSHVDKLRRWPGVPPKEPTSSVGQAIYLKGKNGGAGKAKKLLFESYISVNSSVGAPRWVGNGGAQYPKGGSRNTKKI